MRLLKIVLTAATLLFVTTTATLAADAINTLEKEGFFSYEPNGIAIRGYDTVAYFTQSMPVEGKDDFSTQWSGATWKFSTQEHLDLFVSSPEKYAPQYGGYCAYGVAQKSLVKIEPDQWTVYEDKLYLNYNKKLNSEWRADIPGFIAKANDLFDQLLLDD